MKISKNAIDSCVTETNYMKKWLLAASVRAMKTFAQTAVATIGTSVAISDVNWTLVISAAFLSAIISLLTSVAGLPEVDLSIALETLEKSEEDI